MKEMLAGIAGAEVDKLVETKGMDWVDKNQIMEQVKAMMVSKQL